MNRKVLLILITMSSALVLSACGGSSGGGGGGGDGGGGPIGYVPVPANPAVGTTSDFYVAKYEMKLEIAGVIDITGNNPDQGWDAAWVAVSDPTGQPWVRINQDEAKASCSALGAGYHLITNSEWMTIARNIENTASNWDSGTVGSGAINSGHNDTSPPSSLAASTDNDACSGTEQTCSDTAWDSQRRTHELSNGAVIWDFAGNVYDWVDWNISPAKKAYFSFNLGPVSAWREWTLIDTAILSGWEMDTITWQSSNPAFNSAEGIGQYYAGSASSGGAAMRGGFSNSSAFAGIYALDLRANPSYAPSSVGFRCAFQ